jgi:hypothetical protein
MDEVSITQFIVENFPGVETTAAFGYTFFFYGDDHKLPFATLAASDNDYDSVSNLNRPGVFRLNIGVSKQTFQNLLGSDKVDLNSYDFTALDTIMPHPHYAAQHFICVLNPSARTAETIPSLLTEAYEIAVRRNRKREQTEDANT